MGDYAFISFSQYMQFMPMLVLALAVIPGGIEGVSYAMITTWMNVASEVGAKKRQTEVNAPLSPPLLKVLQ